MSFPPGTEMFQFPGFASAAYGFSGGYLHCGGGLPHSEILGSKPARGSPRLFAACHVLHRLLAPRHPPDALAFLDPPQRQPHRTATRSATRGDPAREHSARERCSGRCRGPFQRQLHYKCCRPPRRAQQAASIPMPNTRPARRRKKKGRTRMTCRRPPRHDAWAGSLLPCPHDGHLITTYDVQRTDAAAPRPTDRAGGRANGALRFGRPGQARATTAAPPRRGSAAWWAWADLNGRPHAYQACALTS